MTAIGHAATGVAVLLLGASLVLAAMLALEAGADERRHGQAATQLRLVVLGAGFAAISLAIDASWLMVVVLLVALMGMAAAPDADAPVAVGERREPETAAVPEPVVAPPAPLTPGVGPLWSRR